MSPPSSPEFDGGARYRYVEGFHSGEGGCAGRAGKHKVCIRLENTAIILLGTFTSGPRAPSQISNFHIRQLENERELC